jgi:hypothetical protein
MFQGNKTKIIIVAKSGTLRRFLGGGGGMRAVQLATDCHNSPAIEYTCSTGRRNGLSRSLTGVGMWLSIASNNFNTESAPAIIYNTGYKF